MIKRTLPLLLLLIASACAELTQVVNQLDLNKPLSQQEVISGLKQALIIGSDSAASGLSSVDGYYGDQMVKILLPPEAQTITENIARIPGGDKMVEDVILRVNRSAEDAAREAGPVFARAVSKMSIVDGFEILSGEKDAATQYLKAQTYDELYQLYQPKIKDSIEKVIVGNISTSQSWNTLTGQWNKLAGSLIGRMADLKTMNTELDRYLTEQALNGLFLKLANEEEEIRNNPAARVTDLLKRVFS